MAASACPNLFVVGSDYTAIGDGSNYHLPVMIYNLSAKRVEGHYLTVGAGASGTISMGAPPLGTAYNVYTNVIATLGYIGGGLAVSLFNTDTMTSTGAAFSNSAVNFAGALKHTPYATVSTLTDANVTDAANAFVVPYTKSHFLVVTPQRCWRIRISDGAIENQFAIDPDSASYSRFNSFVVTASVIPPPMPTASGEVIIYVSEARNAADTANVSIDAIIVFNPTTGTTVSSDYNAAAGSVLEPGCLLPMPDGKIYTHRSDQIYYYTDATLTTRSSRITGSTNPWTYSGGASAQDEWCFFLATGGSNPQYPNICTVDTGAGTSNITQMINDSSARALWAYVQLCSISATEVLYRRAASASTGSSIGSYISIRDKSTGAVATGYTEQQMIDFYSGNTISGTGFNDKTFARKQYGNLPDPALYTVREVLGIMNEDPPPATGTVCKVWKSATNEWVTATPKVYDGTQWVVATAKVRDSSGWV